MLIKFWSDTNFTNFMTDLANSNDELYQKANPNSYESTVEFPDLTDQEEWEVEELAKEGGADITRGT